MKRPLFSVAALLLPAFLIGALCVSSSPPSALHPFSSAADPIIRPKIYGIAFVRFKATDFEKSNAFYAKVLVLGHGKGGCKGLRNPCYVINDYQHVELIQAKTGDSGTFLDEIGFTVFGVKQMQRYLTSHGVKTSKLSRGRNHRQFFVAEDPEHNRIAFVEGPGIVEPWSEDAVHSNPDQVSSHMIHAGFVVKDLDLMKKFYVDLLGFRLYWYGGFKDDGIDWYEIQAPDSDNWVGFMLNSVPTAHSQNLDKPLQSIDEDITAFAYTPDGRIVYSVHRSFKTKLYDLEHDDIWLQDAGGKHRRLLEGQKFTRGNQPFSYIGNSFRFSANGHIILAELLTTTVVDDSGKAEDSFQTLLLDDSGKEIHIAKGDSLIPDAADPFFLPDSVTINFLSEAVKPRLLFSLKATRLNTGAFKSPQQDRRS